MNPLNILNATWYSRSLASLASLARSMCAISSTMDTIESRIKSPHFMMPASDAEGRVGSRRRIFFEGKKKTSRKENMSKMNGSATKSGKHKRMHARNLELQVNFDSISLEGEESPPSERRALELRASPAGRSAPPASAATTAARAALRCALRVKARGRAYQLRRCGDCGAYRLSRSHSFFCSFRSCSWFPAVLAAAFWATTWGFLLWSACHFFLLKLPSALCHGFFFFGFFVVVVACAAGSRGVEGEESRAWCRSRGVEGAAAAAGAGAAGAGASSAAGAAAAAGPSSAAGAGDSSALPRRFFGSVAAGAGAAAGCFACFGSGTGPEFAALLAELGIQ